MAMHDPGMHADGEQLCWQDGDARRSSGRDTLLSPAKQLPYDVLLGQVTSLLSEVRTALRQ